MKIFFKKHSIFTFLLVNFAWTWLFWFLAIPFREQRLLLTAIVMIGGYGSGDWRCGCSGFKGQGKTRFVRKKDCCITYYFLIPSWLVCTSLPGRQYP